MYPVALSAGYPYGSSGGCKGSKCYILVPPTVCRTHSRQRCRNRNCEACTVGIVHTSSCQTCKVPLPLSLEHHFNMVLCRLGVYSGCEASLLKTRREHATCDAMSCMSLCTIGLAQRCNAHVLSILSLFCHMCHMQCSSTFSSKWYFLICQEPLGKSIQYLSRTQVMACNSNNCTVQSCHNCTVQGYFAHVSSNKLIRAFTIQDVLCSSVKSREC